MGIDKRQFSQRYYRVCHSFASFTIPYLCSVYREFEGDMVLCIVLGEIANRNVGQFFEKADDGVPETVLNDPAEHGRLLRPCNAYSVAESTGIPRETVRRRVKVLIKRGWVAENEKGHLFVTQQAAEHFERLTLVALESFFLTAKSLLEALPTRDAPGRRN